MIFKRNQIRQFLFNFKVYSNDSKWYAYRLSLENGSDQLIVTLYTLSIYTSVHKQLIRTIFEAHIVPELSVFQFILARSDVIDCCVAVSGVAAVPFYPRPIHALQ